MSDSFRRYTGDDDDLGSTTRADATRWCRYKRHTWSASQGAHVRTARVTQDDVTTEYMDAREMWHKATRAR